MKLLISPANESEALQAIKGGADIIDVKNPREGPLGANFPWIIRRIRDITPSNLEASCTLGEAPNLPGTITLAALGAATIGINYVKAGLFGCKTSQEAESLIKNVARAVKTCDSSIKVVVAGYADAERIPTIDPMLVPDIARKSKADVAMIDTGIKDGKGLFDFLEENQVQKFIDKAHYYGLRAAIAGSLRKEDLHPAYVLGADIVGLRGAACTYNDREKGQITAEKVRELSNAIRHEEVLT